MCLKTKNKTKMKKNNQSNNDKNISTAPKSIFLWLITIGMLLIAAGTVMPLLTQGGSDLFKYIYGSGAVMLLIGRLFSSYNGDNIRIKRLYRIETWSAIFFCVAVFFMFYEGAGARDWLAFTLAGGAIQIYTSIMIPRTIAKSK